MSLSEHMEAENLRILVEAEIIEPVAEREDGTMVLGQVPGHEWDEELAWRCVRAAYAQAYQDALADDPFPLLAASKLEREAWARLPAS